MTKRAREPIACHISLRHGDASIDPACVLDYPPAAGIGSGSGLQRGTGQLKVIVGFKEFISRGNVVDLAVAVVVGTAFTALVTSLVEDLLTPVIGVIFGQQDFSGLSFSINGSVFSYGNFLNALIAFLSVAAAVYFFVVVPSNAYKERRSADEEATHRECPQCLSEIPAAARRCAHCTTEVEPAT